MAENSAVYADPILGEKWKTWCRLCAKADGKYINVITGECQELINDNCFNCDMDLAHVILDFFRIHIKEDDKLSQIICTECHEVVLSLVKFIERTNKVQQMYNDLQNSLDRTSPSLRMLLENYGIYKDELLMPQNTELPVEKIFVADLADTAISSPIKIDVKNEKSSIENQVETIQKDNNKNEYEDPIGNEDSCSSSSKDGFSSGSDDSYMDISLSKLKAMRKNIDESESKPHKSSEEISNNYENSCKICSKSFQRRSNYSTHMKKYHGVLVCPRCPSAFKTELNLKRHKKEHRKLFSCLHCDQSFEKKGLASSHMKMKHKNSPSFVCEACGEALHTKKQLKQHILTHENYMPFECKVCGKSFKEKYSLKRHSDIHGDKYICPECGKQLSSRANFNNHMLVHSDAMRYKCDYCGRGFKRAKGLKYHLIAHAGLRPYSCDFCEKTFSTGASCRLHKKTMHPVELAALEASGVKAYTKNVPNLNELRAVARTSKNFLPLKSKQNGYVNFMSTKEPQFDEVNSKADSIAKI